MSKSELRVVLRSMRKAYVASLSSADREQLEAGLAQALAPVIQRTSSIAAYAPVGSEIDPRQAIKGRMAAFPRFDGEGNEFRFATGEPDAPGRNGIPQPHAHHPVIDPDLILVPLLGIDPDGHRLGQGKGHYDRVLGPAKARGALLIGVGWALQRLPFPLPHDPWDIALDGFASPDGLELFR